MEEQSFCPACGSSELVQNVIETDPFMTKCASCGFFGHEGLFVGYSTIVLKNKRSNESQYHFDTLTWSYRKKAKERPSKPTQEDWIRAFGDMIETRSK